MPAPTPLKQPEPEQDSLQSVADYHLRQYFMHLNGMSPAANLHKAVVSQIEKPLIENVLRYVRGNQVRAASILGINRNTLRKKMTDLSVDVAKTLKD